MSRSLFAGTAALIRLALRRDRIKLTIWLVGLPLLLLAMAGTYQNFFASPEEMIEMTVLRSSSPVMRMFDPPISGASIAGFTMLESYTFIAVLIALMSSQALVRHTRQNEDTGRAEMIGAAVVGRYAGLAAGLIVAAGASLALVPLFTLVLAASGFSFSGALAAGAGYGGIGLFFAGIAAVTAQLSSTSRGANGLCGAVLGLSFLLASTGNILGRVAEGGLRVNSAWPAWLSPLGWGGQIRPFHDNNWWVLALFAAAFVILTALAMLLASKRDIGAGLLPARKGSPVAHPSLARPFGLAWRLQRGSWLGWAIGVVMMGAVFGGVTNELEKMIESNEKMMEMMEQFGGAAALTDTFFAMTMSIIGSITAVHLVLSLLRMRSEEEEGTLEQVLSTSLSRIRWKLGYIACAVAGNLGLLLILGAVTGITAALVTGEGSWMVQLPLAALVQLPPALLLGSAAVLAFGAFPRLSAVVAWAGVAISFLAGPLMADLLRLPSWLQNISPFSHVSSYPAESVEAFPILGLLVAAAVLAAAGVLLFRRRSLYL